MKKSIINLSNLCLLTLFLLTSCTKEEVEVDGYEIKASEDTGLDADSFGTTKDWPRDTPLPKDWLYVTNADVEESTRKIVSTKGALYKSELTIAPTKNLPDGWYFTPSETSKSGSRRAVYIDGKRIGFGDTTTIEQGILPVPNGAPEGWAIVRIFFTKENFWAEPVYFAEIIYLGESFRGYEARVLEGQTLPYEWDYVSGGDANKQATIRNVRGELPPVDPTPPSLLSGETLWGGQFKSSPNGQYVLTMQNDGNVVLYDRWNTTLDGYWTVLWHSNTFNNPGARLVMQGDGNLVVYSSSNQALWNSGTWGNPGAQLHVQDDSDLIIYSNGVEKWSR